MATTGLINGITFLKKFAMGDGISRNSWYLKDNENDIFIYIILANIVKYVRF